MVVFSRVVAQVLKRWKTDFSNLLNLNYESSLSSFPFTGQENDLNADNKILKLWHYC
jgi:hypothetical protein